MGSPSKPPTLQAAEPQYGQSFDPWNSSSTGHQRAENHLGGSTGWRDSRNMKLMSQFNGGVGGGQRVSDTVGAGSQDWDAKAHALISPELRFRAKNSIMDMLVKPGNTTKPSVPSTSQNGRRKADQEIPEDGNGSLTSEERLMAWRKSEDELREAEKTAMRQGIFAGVVVYVNGSTHPTISDHKLKHVMAEYGGRLSSHLGRRQVTHVIIGKPVGAAGGGAGGGLAGGKLQKEIQKVGGAGVKFVNVEWVLESIKAGKRLPEARFSSLKIASKGQQSVYSLYSKQKTAVPEGQVE